MKVCAKCGITKPGSEFNKRAVSQDGLTNQCKSCACAYTRERYRRDPDKWRAMKREQNLRWRSNHAARKTQMEKSYLQAFPEKRAAHRAIKNALLFGSIHRPDRCEWCKKECKPQAHHWDYSKPLDVIWLCPLCHRSEHGGLPRVLIPEGLADLIQAVS